MHVMKDVLSVLKVVPALSVSKGMATQMDSVSNVTKGATPVETTHVSAVCSGSTTTATANVLSVLPTAEAAPLSSCVLRVNPGST